MQAAEASMMYVLTSVGVNQDLFYFHYLQIFLVDLDKIYT